MWPTTYATGPVKPLAALEGGGQVSWGVSTKRTTCSETPQHHTQLNSGPQKKAPAASQGWALPQEPRQACGSTSSQELISKPSRWCPSLGCTAVEGAQHSAPPRALTQTHWTPAPSLRAEAAQRNTRRTALTDRECLTWLVSSHSAPPPHTPGSASRP